MSFSRVATVRRNREGCRGRYKGKLSRRNISVKKIPWVRNRGLTKVFANLDTFNRPR